LRLLWAVGWIAAICRRRGGASGEAGGGETPLVRVGAGRSEGELDATRADADEPGEFEELQPDRAAGRLGELGVRKADAPERAEENIGKRGEPEPLWLSYDEPWFTSHGQRAVGPPARHAWGQ
jgi:hypothetical protein